MSNNVGIGPIKSIPTISQGPLTLIGCKIGAIV